MLFRSRKGGELMRGGIPHGLEAIGKVGKGIICVLIPGIFRAQATLPAWILWRTIRGSGGGRLEMALVGNLALLAVTAGPFSVALRWRSEDTMKDLSALRVASFSYLLLPPLTLGASRSSIA